MTQHVSKVFTVCARRSALSRIQVSEVLQELNRYHQDILFDCHFVDTQGDKDLETSLRFLEKTNFFTKEIDDLLISEACRIAIHSAKDLPHPLPEGLSMVALTKGLDPADSLVLRNGESLLSLPKGAIIATSSLRREDAVKQLRSDLSFVDLRGTISQRLTRLEDGTADGIVVAEAALIRLGLTHLNRIKLLGEPAALQGRLAIVAKNEDIEMKELFACIDSRS